MTPGSLLHLRMNDQELRVEKGLTILQAARQNGIEIPTLCDFPGLPPRGSCRMCIVEIQGRQNTPTACTTPVEEGMVIFTHSPKIQSLRTELLQMLLAEHPAGCLFCPERGHCNECMVTVRKSGVTSGCGSCPKDNQCELQALAVQYGVEKPGYPIRYRMLPIETHDPFFDRDDNLCILCGRCIRVCESLHFNNALAYTYRGTNALVSTSFHRDHLNSDCVFCGSCVEACPTGALSEKTRKWDGKPERSVETTCPLCSIGCQMNLLVKQERVLGSLPNHSAGTEVLCVKGRFGITELVNHPTRLKQPQKRVGNFRQEIGWVEAIRTAAEKLSACLPERFEMRISPSCSSEDLFVARQFAQDVMKTGQIRFSFQDSYDSDLESISRLVQKSCSLENIAEAQTVLCLGLDDPYAHTVVEVQLHRAKERGTRVILLGVNKPAWGVHVDEWLPANHGQEVTLVEKLVAITGAEPISEAAYPALARAGRLLREAETPVIILGPAALSHPDNQRLLMQVELLVSNLHARVICLPDQANLRGALQLGLFSEGVNTGKPDLDVLYLIGEAVPEHLPGSPFILAHSLYPPAGAIVPDLLLPSTAFTEESGTYIDYSGRTVCTRPAVRPKGDSLPAWRILSQIARQMGVQGFDYNCVEDIWRSAQAEFPEVSSPAASKTGQVVTIHPVYSETKMPCAHFYMGFPLKQWVEGLRSLYPDGTLEGSDGTDS